MKLITVNLALGLTLEKVDVGERLVALWGSVST